MNRNYVFDDLFGFAIVDEKNENGSSEVYIEFCVKDDVSYVDEEEPLMEKVVEWWLDIEDAERLIDKLTRYVSSAKLLKTNLNLLN